MKFSTVFIHLFSVLISLIIVGNKFAASVSDFKTPKYSFQYSVEAPHYNVVNNHWEERHGNQVRGGYGLLDPDGKIRVVEYKVDGKSGFQAVVRYRKPPEPFLRGHLRFPWQYRRPLWLVKPVSFITPDLFKPSRPYPNFHYQ